MDSRVSKALRRFVSEVEERRAADMSFRDDPKLKPLPVSVEDNELSRYLLIAAAVDAQVDSRGVRPFLVRLDGKARQARLPRGLFDISEDHANDVLSAVTSEPRMRTSRIRGDLPRIIAEANAFVDAEAKGDFDSWARGFTDPQTIVAALARGIYGLGRGAGETRKRLWMLMRWLVRPYPDLRRWDHLSPEDLMVPVDGHVARFAVSLGLIPAVGKDGPRWRDVEAITEFAREMFPEDPARIDYAFFMWGRARREGRGAETCAGLFHRAGVACPLSGVMPCSNHCRA
jgi:hypothetical protein